MALNLPDHQYAVDANRPGSGFGKVSSQVVIETNWAAANLTVDSQQRVWKCDRSCFVRGFVLTATDMDTHATPTLKFDVGTNSDDDEFIDAATVGQGGGSTDTNVVAVTTEQWGFPLAADEYIIISVETAAATAAAGTTRLIFEVLDLGV